MAKVGKKGRYSGSTGVRIVRWVVLLAVLAGLGFGGWALTGRVGDQLDDAEKDLHARLQRTYGKTTLAEVDMLNQASVDGGTEDKENLDKFLDKAGTDHSMFKPEKNGFVAKYHASAWGRERTVSVHWTEKGVKVVDEG